MKIIVRIISLLMAVVLSAVFLTSCDKNSLRPHDDLPAIKPVFLYVGYRYNTTATKYVEYTDEDLQKLNDIGVKEVCISFGNSAASYIPEGESEPKPIVTNEDIDGITMEMIGATSQDSVEIIKTGYKTKLSDLDENLILNDYADFAIEFANRLIAINPDIEIWYSFPDIHIATLAELYIEPFLEYYKKLKNDTDAQVWEKNIKGMYWVREDVPAKTYDVFNTQNLVDFDNKTVKAMKACTDAVHKDDKFTFWCPYYRSTADVGLPVGFIANQTDIFDYVILQPNHLFEDGLEDNIEIIKQSTLNNAVMNNQNVTYGGEKKSSTMIGPEFEMQAEDFNGSNGAHNIEKYQDYVDAYKDMIGEYSVALYCGSRPSIMDNRVIGFIEELLKDSN